MNSIIRWVIMLSVCVSPASLFAQTSDFPVLKSPYLGQKPPGMTPEILAPGIVSTNAGEFGSTFTPDGREFYFAISGAPFTVIAFMKLADQGWTRPEIAPFSGKYGDWDLNFSPDGKKLYFTSDRPFSGKGPRMDNSNLWVVEKTKTGWSTPKSLGAPINTDGSDNYPSTTDDGTLYFFHNDKGENDSDIYFSRSSGDTYSESVRLGEAINSTYAEWDPFIAPDESYLLFCSVNRPDGYGDSDLYISFRREDGTWTEAVNMGEKINTSKREICPSITADGKYLLFTSARKVTDKSFCKRQANYQEMINELTSPGNGESDIYWVDARVIDQFRPSRRQESRDTHPFPVLKGPYLGQEPPGMTPEIFAPGIVSKGFRDNGITFTPDGKEVYFGLEGVSYGVILCMKEENNRWTSPQVASFSGRYYDGEPNLSPDGNKLFFCSYRPVDGIEKPLRYADLWVTERTEKGWGKPVHLGPVINSEKWDVFPSLSNTGNLYFASYRNENWDIYTSTSVNGNYTKPEKLGDAINSAFDDFDAYIDPDEEYMIFCSSRPSDGYGRSDLYISFRNGDGTWTHAKNMGEEINSSRSELCPTVTADGKYIFFYSERNLFDTFSDSPITYEKKMNIVNSPGNGKGDIFWVDAKVIDLLRPNGSN